MYKAWNVARVMEDPGLVCMKLRPEAYLLRCNLRTQMHMYILLVNTLSNVTFDMTTIDLFNRPPSLRPTYDLHLPHIYCCIAWSERLWGSRPEGPNGP